MSKKLKNKIQQMVASAVSFTTAISMTGVSLLVPSAAFAAELGDGSLISVDGDPNVWIAKEINGKKFKRLILDELVFESYGHLDWNDIITVSQSVLDSYTMSNFVRVFDPENGVDDPMVFFQLPNEDGDDGFVNWVNVTAEEFTDLLGADWDSVYTINVFERDIYTQGDDITDVASLEAAQAQALGEGSGSGDDDDTVATGDGFTVTANDMPSAGVTPLSATNVVFMDFDVTSADDFTINGMTFTRKGVGSDNDFSNVYLYEGDNRLTTGKSVGSDTQQVTFGNLNLVFDDNETRNFRLMVDTSTGTAGNINFFELSSITTEDDVEVDGLPISGTTYTWSASTAGVLTIATGGTPSNPSLGEINALLAQFKLSASSAEDMEVERIALTNSGSANLDGVQNWSLLFGGEEVAASSVVNDIVTFVFDEPFLVKKGQSRTFEVRGDLTGGGLKRSETIRLYLDETADLFGTGLTFGAGTGVTNNFTTSTGSTNLTLQGGTVTVTFSGLPAARDIAQGADEVVFLDFTISSEENVEFRSTQILFENVTDSDITTQFSGNHFTDIKMIDVDTGGAVVGPFDINDMTDGGGATASKTETDRYTVNSGQTRHFQISADVADAATASKNYRVHLAAFGSSAIKSLDTGNFVNTADIVPSSAIVGNQLQVKASSLNVTVASTPASDTFVKGTNDIPAAGFLFKAGDASDIIVTSLKLSAYVDDTTSGTFTKDTDGTVIAQNLIGSVRIFDGTTQLGTSESFDADGETTFNGLSWNIPAGATKKLSVQVNVPNQTLGNSNSDRFKIDIADTSADITSTDEDGNDVTETTDGPNSTTSDAGTRITISNSGSLAVSLDSAATPKQDIVLAGTSNVLFGVFKFAATDEAFTVTKLAIRNGTTTGNYDDNITQVTLEYPKSDGSTGTSIGNFDNTGTSTFSDLAFFVPKDGTAQLKVKYDLGQVEANGGGADSGDQPQAIFEADMGFEATALGSSTRVTNAGSDVNGNAMILRNARPTLEASKPSTVTKLVSQTDFDLIDVKITAAGNDDVAVKKMKLTFNLFDVATVGSALTVGGSGQWKIYDVTDLNNELGSNTSAFENGTGSQDPSFTTGNSNSTTTNLYVTFDSEERIEAGTSKTYRIRTRIQNAHENNNGKDSVTVQLATEEDANIRTGAITADANNVIQVATTDVSLVWSDLSAGETTHAETLGSSSTDWTNGHKIKNLPSSSVTHEK